MGSFESKYKAMMKQIQNRKKRILARSLKTLTIISLFLFDLSTLSLPQGFTQGSGNSQAGVFPKTLRDVASAQSLGWLQPIHQLIQDHELATGQILRLEFRNQASKSSNQVFAETRQGLLDLPLEIGARQEACFFLGTYFEKPGGLFEIQFLNIECGIRIYDIPENSTLRRALASLEGRTLNRRNFEAALTWIALELLRACESPLISGEVHNQERFLKFPDELRDFFSRWKKSSLEGTEFQNIYDFSRGDLKSLAQLSRSHGSNTEWLSLFTLTLGCFFGFFTLKLLSFPIWIISSTGARRLSLLQQLKVHLNFYAKKMGNLLTRKAQEKRQRDLEILNG
jgi:hypothetical protein